MQSSPGMFQSTHWGWVHTGHLVALNDSALDHVDIHLLSGKGESVLTSPASPEQRTLLVFHGITALDTVLWTDRGHATGSDSSFTPKSSHGAGPPQTMWY